MLLISSTWCYSGIARSFGGFACYAFCPWVSWIFQCYWSKINTYHNGSHTFSGFSSKSLCFYYSQVYFMNCYWRYYIYLMLVECIYILWFTLLMHVNIIYADWLLLCNFGHFLNSSFTNFCNFLAYFSASVRDFTFFFFVFWIFIFWSGRCW